MTATKRATARLKVESDLQQSCVVETDRRKELRRRTRPERLRAVGEDLHRTMAVAWRRRRIAELAKLLNRLKTLTHQLMMVLLAHLNIQMIPKSRE